ncbi:MAG: pyruvate dehydrogenase complex dihydrolipoamide acetyltransferase [Cytophagales bacterium]|nr:pyruvate dehydrogenase complex dihydrolipoamide acetyltransferase [Cytophagales bacterium]
MAEIVTMPKLSDTMTEGVIAVWHKKVGDAVEEGELMAEIESDKATMEYESYHEGTVLYLGAAEGESIAVDGVLAIVGEAGEDYKSLLEGGSTPTAETAPVAEESAPAEAIDVSNIDAEIVTMPKLSDTMTEGVIAVWHKKVGDSVEEGELMAEIESDKATMEYESFSEGTVLYLGAAEGEGIEVDGVLAIVGAADADWETLLKSASQTAAPTQAEEAPSATPEATAASAVQEEAVEEVVETSNGRVKASPLAKALAKDKGYDLSKIKGTGPNGRVIKSDVESYTPAAAPVATSSAPAEAKAEVKEVVLPSIVAEEKYTDQPVSQMRKVIGKRLADSKFTAPHFYVTMEINMDNAMTARKSMNAIAPVKLSFNDMVIKATAVALRSHPAINSAWLGDSIRVNEHVNVGVAVAIPDGLVVPVVKFADNKSLSHISQEVKQLVGKAKGKGLSGDEMSGSTFTISNLGMFGVEEFTGIINTPNAAILAVGGIKQTPVVKDGQIVPGNVMKVTLSSDHRVVDGADAAAFLATLKNLLEDPVRILI